MAPVPPRSPTPLDHVSKTSSPGVNWSPRKLGAPVALPDYTANLPVQCFNAERLHGCVNTLNAHVKRLRVERDHARDAYYRVCGSGQIFEKQLQMTRLKRLKDEQQWVIDETMEKLETLADWRDGELRYVSAKKEEMKEERAVLDERLALRNTYEDMEVRRAGDSVTLQGVADAEDLEQRRELVMLRARDRKLLKFRRYYTEVYQAWHKCEKGKYNNAVKPTVAGALIVCIHKMLVEYYGVKDLSTMVASTKVILPPDCALHSDNYWNGLILTEEVSLKEIFWVGKHPVNDGRCDMLLIVPRSSFSGLLPTNFTFPRAPDYRGHVPVTWDCYKKIIEHNRLEHMLQGKTDPVVAPVVDQNEVIRQQRQQIAELTSRVLQLERKSS